MALGLELDEEQQAALLAYVALLSKWNRAYNLTAVRKPAEIINRHLLDSLAALPYLNGKRLVDVGSGAGLPGLVLAIARPDQHWVLLDSNGKKTRFLTQALIELELSNVRIVRQRVEDYQPATGFSTVICRGVGPLMQLLTNTRHLWDDSAVLLALKGVRPDAELREMERAYPNYVAHRLHVPGNVGERHVIVVNLPQRMSVANGDLSASGLSQCVAKRRKPERQLVERSRTKR